MKWICCTSDSLPQSGMCCYCDITESLKALQWHIMGNSRCYWYLSAVTTLPFQTGFVAQNRVGLNFHTLIQNLKISIFPFKLKAWMLSVDYNIPGALCMDVSCLYWSLLGGLFFQTGKELWQENCQRTECSGVECWWKHFNDLKW